MRITYYLEVLSSWCHWAEPTWAELQRRYAGRAEFQWRIALMRPTDFPSSRDQCDWFYRRSGTFMRSPYMLNSGWFEAELAGRYEIPNYVAEAGRDLGVTDDRLRLALAHAAVREGRKIGQLNEAVAVGAAALGLDAQALRVAADSAAVKERVRQSTEKFSSYGIDQRPAFVLENAIGDRAIFSGLTAIEPLAATLDSMLEGAATYASFAAHYGKPPA